jgi:hypothetical protein
MTTKQELQSNIVTRVKSAGIVRPKVASKEALEVLERSPIKTVWGWDFGRPIYDRLPAISQQYKKGYDRDQAFVYLDPQFGQYEGPGSLDVVTFFEDPTKLIVENGVITWKMGQVAVDGFNVDITALNNGAGLFDGDYKVGYELSYDVPVSDSLVPGYALATVENSTLGDAAINIGVSGASQYHEAYFAISDADIGTSWWPGINTVAGNYYPGSWFVLDFRSQVTASKFEVIADPNEPVPTATMAVYGSNDAIVWDLAQQVKPSGDRWIADIVPPEEFRYWKLFFWNGSASISDIVYSGTAYFPDLRVSGPVQVATPYVESLYEETPSDFLLLAAFKVVKGKIGTITDYRNFTSQKYEPVADWLTDFQDSNLRCVFEAVENYAELYMAPPTADYHFYKELDDSVCFGLGEFDLGGEIGTINFPSKVEFWCSREVETGSSLSSYSFNVVPPDGELATNPGETVILTDGRVVINDVCGISPNQVILLKDPEDPGDLSTLFSANHTLFESWSIDNGIYY